MALTEAEKKNKDDKKEEEKNQVNEEKGLVDENYEENYDTSPGGGKLTKAQINELNTRGLLSGDTELIDTEGLTYVLNENDGLLVLPDLGENGFALRARQLVNLSKLFKEEEIMRSDSVRIALSSGDLKAVKLEGISQSDIKKQDSEIDKLEKRYDITEEGTKIPLKVNRHNNPFLMKLWDVERKSIREKRMNQQDLNLKEIPLHAEESYKKFDEL